MRFYRNMKIRRMRDFEVDRGIRIHSTNPYLKALSPGQ